MNAITVECFKHDFMGYTSRGVVDSGAEGDLNCGVPAQDVAEAKTISMWPRDHSCDILAKKVAAFCSCPKKKKIYFRPN